MVTKSGMKTTRNSSEDRVHDRSNDNGDFGLSGSSFQSRMKYSHARKRNINTLGYQTFYGKRRRGSKSHVRTIFRKRSGYDYNGRRKRSSIFESYGEADSFDRRKVRDVYDVTGQANEKRERNKLGGYIESEHQVVVSGQKKDDRQRSDGKSSEKSRSTQKSNGHGMSDATTWNVSIRQRQSN
ncbi:unnamed protein product [Schistosoma turkestanicum]|nr:unnamed protein product [Schistosoma turkestanicum]